MPVKKCVGAVIYNDDGEIFLMTSPKWEGYIVPGGEIEEETEEEALRREVREELGIEITDIERAGEIKKEASDDFHDPEMRFHFIDFYAKAESTNITPNWEVDEHGWFPPEEALGLPLMDSTRELVERYVREKR